MSTVPITAQTLITHYDLMIDGKPHDIVETEMYLHTVEHPDPYVHKYQEQELPNTFYFHRMGQSYREGTYRGIDVTLGGGKGTGLFHGVLIRSIFTPSGELISGPCCCANYILEKVGATTVKEYVDTHMHGDTSIFNSGNPLYIVPKKTPIYSAIGGTTPLIETPRVGLWIPKSAPENKLTYVGRKYRYVLDNVLRRRGHMKGKHHIYVSLLLKGHTTDEVKNIVGGTKQSIEKVRKAMAAAPTETTAVVEKFGGLKSLTGDSLVAYLTAIMSITH